MCSSGGFAADSGDGVILPGVPLPTETLSDISLPTGLRMAFPGHAYMGSSASVLVARSSDAWIETIPALAPAVASARATTARGSSTGIWSLTGFTSLRAGSR